MYSVRLKKVKYKNFLPKNLEVSEICSTFAENFWEGF